MAVAGAPKGSVIDEIGDGGLVEVGRGCSSRPTDGTMLARILPIRQTILHQSRWRIVMNKKVYLRALCGS